MTAQAVNKHNSSGSAADGFVIAQAVNKHNSSGTAADGCIASTRARNTPDLASVIDTPLLQARIFAAFLKLIITTGIVMPSAPPPLMSNTASGAASSLFAQIMPTAPAACTRRA
jgi:hypothetical protein